MRFFNHDDTSPRWRAIWAKSIDRLVKDLQRRPGILRATRPVYSREVAAACVPAFLRIREVLVDPEAPVTPQAMFRLREFMTNGLTSPFFEESVAAAERASRELASAFVVPAVTLLKPAARFHDVEREDLRQRRAS